MLCRKGCNCSDWDNGVALMKWLKTAEIIQNVVAQRKMLLECRHKQHLHELQ